MSGKRALANIQRLDVRLELFLLWFVVFFLCTHGLMTLSEWLNSWFHWDAQWYQKMLSPGYPTDDLRQLAFPPGYSLLVKSLSLIFRSDFMRTAQVVNVVSFYGACIFACRVLKKYFKVEPTLLFATFLLITPNYFIFTAYSDTLFLFLFWLLIHVLVFNPEKRTPVFLISLVLPWVRITGYAFLSLILQRRWSVVLGLLISLAGWLAFQKFYSGDYFYFMTVQKEFGVPDGNIYQGFMQAYGDFQNSVSSILGHIRSQSLLDVFSRERWVQFFSDPQQQKMVAVGLLPFVSFIFLATILVICVVTERSFVGLISLSVLILSHNQALWRSTVRYNWPLYMIACAFLLHQVATHKGQAKIFWVSLSMVTLASSFLLQLWYGYAFMKDGWAF